MPGEQQLEFLKPSNMQHTSHILMIQPVSFDFNSETAVNNRFQARSGDNNKQEKALAEFTHFVALLRQHGIDVTVVEDSPEPHTPDSVFPNNWLSLHEDGTLVLYPMFAENRRLERKQQVLDQLKEKFTISKIIDLTHFEKEHLFLEGTGSMVLDREHKIVYACISPRTDETVLAAFCKRTGYQPLSFVAVDQAGVPIYHTNVMMCVADSYVVICLDAIPDKDDRQELIASFRQTHKEIININLEQMNQFAGNMLQVHDQQGKTSLVMSTQAYVSLSKEQVEVIEKHNPILHADISTIEANGGGSARCMMAEIFLPPKAHH